MRGKTKELTDQFCLLGIHFEGMNAPLEKMLPIVQLIAWHKRHALILTPDQLLSCIDTENFFIPEGNIFL